MMEVTINAQTVVTAAAVISALGAIGGVGLWCFKFVERDKRQTRELAAIREEQTVICFGVLACLKGLREQGCNGPVTEALSRLEKHLNRAAHSEEV